MPNTNDDAYVTLTRKDYETARAALRDAITATTGSLERPAVPSCDPARAADYQRLLTKLND